MSQEKINVFYDGGCVVCSAEISHYMSKDHEGKVCFIDINDENFNASQFGFSDQELHENLHVTTESGEVKKGVDAFIAIWQTIPGFGFMAKFFRYEPFYTLSQMGYFVFAKIRPYLPRKKRLAYQKIKD